MNNYVCMHVCVVLLGTCNWIWFYFSLPVGVCYMYVFVRFLGLIDMDLFENMVLREGAKETLHAVKYGLLYM